MDGERVFFQRLSSIKVEYEKSKRRTLSETRVDSLRQSDIAFFQTKEQIQQKLQTLTLHHNLNELYAEILCLLFSTAESQDKCAPLVRFLQTVFKIDADTHSTLMDKTKVTEIGRRVLHLEVQEAKDLAAKDLNGLSDPFCTLYVTRKDRSQRTRVIEKSLNPKWNEYFKFDVTIPQNDVLIIHVWDQDPEEKLRDKLRRVVEIKSPASAYNFLREASHGRASSQEYMGKVQIPIREMSTETIEKWVPLLEGQGEIYLRMTLGVDKDRQTSQRDYRIALEVLTAHELVKGDVLVPFHWEFRFEPWAEYLLRQLRNGWGLKTKDVRLVKWQALVRINSVFPVSPQLIATLAKSLFTSIQTEQYNAIEMSLIWRTAGEYLEFATNFVKNLHAMLSCTVTISQLYHILKTLEVIGNCEEGKGQTSISAHVIRTEIQIALAKGANNKFECLTEAWKRSEVDEESWISMSAEAGKILKLGQLLNDDLKHGQNLLQNDFKLILKVDYHGITYQVYDKEFGDLVEPLVSKFCGCLKWMSDSQQQGSTHSESKNAESSHESTFAVNFFHLYLAVKQFATFAYGKGDWRVCGRFHSWFFPGLSHVLDILAERWKKWMSRAVDYQYKEMHSNLIVYKSNYKITSSAIDSVQIIYAMQSFWVSLEWPDPEEALFLVQKVLKELCGFSICYANLVSERLEKFENAEEETCKEYKVSLKLCRSINNIDHVGTYVRELGGQLNIGSIVESFPRAGVTEAELLNKQLEIQMAGLDGVLSHVLTTMATKMKSRICELLPLVFEENRIGGNPTSKALDNCLAYYHNNLEIIGTHLITDYYAMAVGAIWEQTLSVFTLLFNQAVKSEKCWEYFSGMRETVEIVKGFLETALLLNVPSYKAAHQLSHTNKLRDLCKLIHKSAFSPSDIKKEYYLSRLEEEEDGTEVYGMITIRTYFQKTSQLLHVQVLNARNLQSADSDGLSDPYVEVTLVPSEDFPGLDPFYTKVVKKNLYPIFEDKFAIGLSEACFNSGGFVQLTVFDHDFLMRDDFLGEAFFALKEIRVSEFDTKLEDCKQKHLKLSKPTEKQTAFLDTFIETRSWDKQLVAFVRKEKNKIITKYNQ